jgi:hypothetical protein
MFCTLQFFQYPVGQLIAAEISVIEYYSKLAHSIGFENLRLEVAGDGWICPCPERSLQMPQRILLVIEYVITISIAVFNLLSYF